MSCKTTNEADKNYNQEPIGTRIAKAVCEAKKISERIFGYVAYDIQFTKATYTGTTQRPAKITPIEKGIVGILNVDETSSFEKIGSILGLDVVNDKAEASILRNAIDSLLSYRAIEGSDPCLVLTESGRIYAEKGERPETYTKQFDIYVDKSHKTWRNIKNCIGDNTPKIVEADATCEDLNLTLDELKQYAECQAQDVHFPQNRYLLEKADWVYGREGSYKVYVCFVQSVASAETRAFVYDENIGGLNPLVADYINSDDEFKSELLRACIQYECETDPDTTILQGDEIEQAKAEIPEEIKQAERQLVEEEQQGGETHDEAAAPNEASGSERKIQDDGRLHKKALYDSLSFENELHKIFREDNPDEIWLISPWIKGAFLQTRVHQIEKFLKDRRKRIFMAYSKPVREGEVMVDGNVRPKLKQLIEQYHNLFCVQLPEFHLKNVVEVRGEQKVLFSGSFNVLSFSVNKSQSHVRREEMMLVHHSTAKSKYDELQLEFAEIYADAIKKEIESIEPAKIESYKDERLEYFLGVERKEVRELFSPIEDLLEEKKLEGMMDRLSESVSIVSQELIAAADDGGLNAERKTEYESLLKQISRELSDNAIDDPSPTEMFTNCEQLLQRTPVSKKLAGRSAPSGVALPGFGEKSAPAIDGAKTLPEIKTMVQAAMKGKEKGATIKPDDISKAKSICSQAKNGLSNIDQLFKTLSAANAIVAAVKTHRVSETILNQVYDCLRSIVARLDDFESLRFTYRKAKAHILIDVGGVQFQFYGLELNDELLEVIYSHEDRRAKWDGSKTGFFSADILRIATKYTIM